METSNDLTTLVCLFHHQDQAQAAIDDLTKAGVPRAAISFLDETGSRQGEYGTSFLNELGVPEHDQAHLLEGVRRGGLIVGVSAMTDHVSKVEGIFGDHRAEKIDEAVRDRGNLSGAPIPVVEEELAVGKRPVAQGGVRVYRRIVEIPVEETVGLREEHVTVERRAVDRPVTDRDLAAQGDRTIELTETAEEAVVGKSARVVEEVLVGKSVGERVERVHDTVRRTEVEVEEVTPESSYSQANKKF